MCWLSKELKELNTEDNSVKVYKVVQKDGEKFNSPYYSKIWKLNEIVRSKPLIKTIRNKYAITEGLHSYITLFNAVHHFRRMSANNLVVVEAEIPPNSTYYVNKSGEVVSDKLKIIKPCVG